MALRATQGDEKRILTEPRALASGSPAGDTELVFSREVQALTGPISNAAHFDV